MAASRALHALLPDPNPVSPDPSLSDPNVPEFSLPSSFHSPPPSPRQPRRPSGVPRPGPSKLAEGSGSRSDGLKPDGNHITKRGNSSEGEETDRRPESPSTVVDEPPRAPPRPKTRQISSGAPRPGLTLREQEAAVDRLDKENFSLKMKIYFLEERLRELSPEGVERALKQNIELKIECSSSRKENKRLSKLILECEKALEEQSGRITAQEAEIANLKDQLRHRGTDANGVSSDGSQALRKRNSELEEALKEAQKANEDLERETERLRLAGEVSLGKGRIDRMKDTFEKRIAELEEANAALLEEKQIQADELDKMEEEKQQLLEEVEDLRLETQRLEQQQEAALAERSESRAEVDEERDRTEHMTYTIDSLRDELAASYIDQDRKEEDIKQMAEELATKEEEIEQLEADWRGELEAAKARADQAREEHERQVLELQEVIQEHEAEMDEFREKAEEEMQLWQEKLVEKDEELRVLKEEVEEANEKIQRYGEQVFDLEDELGQKAKELEESERQRQLLLREQGETEEMHTAVVDGLKDKVTQKNAENQQLQEMYEKARQTLLEAHDNIEMYESKVAELENALSDERHLKELAEMDKAAESKKRGRDQERWQDEKNELEEYWGRIAADKDLIAERLRVDLKDAQDRLARTQGDLDYLKSDLNETRKLSESRTADQFSLQLEYDRIKRDLGRCEDDIERLRRELDKKEELLREREGDINAAHARNLEMHSQLASVTQARLNLSDKLDVEQQARKAAEGERDSYRARVQDLEQRSSKAERSVMTNGEQLRAQVTERNTLLMTVFTCVDDVLGGHNRKEIQRPFDNFQAFHDKLLKRLNALTQIRADFDRRCKDAEAKFTERMGGMDKQLQVRMKQLDKVETAVRSVSEAKLSWRKKLSMAEGELEAIKGSNAELARQLDSAKRGSSVDSASDLRAALTRATNAEKQALAAQNRLRSAEERFAARLKEFEAREKLAEEKVKRERQGAKELQAKILADSDRRLKDQINLAEKREGHIRDLRDTEPR